jgi:DNA-binding MarR family transcriptional regulator
MQYAGSEQVASILRAVLALGRRLRAERPQGSVSLSEISILATLNRLGSIPAIRVAAEERLQPQSLTRIVTSLERDGLIARKRSDADRREIVIALTEGGRRVLVQEMQARRAWLEAAVAAALTEAERDLLFEASEAMLKLAFHDGTAANRSKA